MDNSESADSPSAVEQKEAEPSSVVIAADEAEAAQGEMSQGVRSAECEIRSDHDDVYAGPCLFTPEEGGSFALSLPGDQPIVPNIVLVSVWLTGDGMGEVRGLTTDGISSRWGEVTRSADDPACWTGSDFEICAR